MSISGRKTAAMFASAGAVALIVLLLGAARERSPSSTAAGTTAAVVRGSSDRWYEFSYPIGWYEIVHGHVAVQNRDPDLLEGTPGALARMTIYGRRKACDYYDCASWAPTGTVISAVSVDGIPATRYDIPITGTIPALRGESVVDLDGSSLGTYFQLDVVDASTQQEHDDLMADLDAALASMNIISGNVDTSIWVEHYEGAPGIPMLDEYGSYTQPAGWCRRRLHRW